MTKRLAGIVGGDSGRDRGILRRAGECLGSIVFFSLLALIVFSVIPYGLVDPWWEAAFECGVFAVTACWILESLLSGTWQFKGLWLVLPLLLITAYAFVQTIEWPAAWHISNSGLIEQHSLTIDRYQTFLTARKSLALTLFLSLLLIHTSTARRFRWLVRVVIAVGLGSAIFGILRQFLQSPDSTTGFVLPFLFYGVGYGQFISANVFAYVLEMPFGLLVGLILGGGMPRDRMVSFLAMAIFVWAALVLSNSRGAILGFACQSVVLFFFAMKWHAARRLSREEESPRWLEFVYSSPLIRLLMAGLLLVALIAGVLWMGGEPLGLKLVKEVSGQVNTEGTSREAIWHSTWEVIKHRPLTGAGFGALFLAIPQYQGGPGFFKIEQAHNDYLDLAANGGLVAVALAGWFVAMLIRQGLSSLRSNDNYRRAAALGAIAGVVSVSVHSFVDFGLQITGIAVVFAALIVILVADKRVEQHRVRSKGTRQSAGER